MRAICASSACMIWGATQLGGSCDSRLRTFERNPDTVYCKHLMMFPLDYEEICERCWPEEGLRREIPTLTARVFSASSSWRRSESACTLFMYSLAHTMSALSLLISPRLASSSRSSSAMRSSLAF